MTASDRSRVLVTIAAAVAALAASSLVFGADVLELSGAWTLDREASDEPADVLEPVTRRKSGRFGGLRAGVSIFGIPVDVTDVIPDGDEGGAEPQDETRRELDKVHRYVTEAVNELEIDVTADTLRVAYDDLGTYIYKTGESVEYKDAVVDADWRQGRYVVVRQVKDGPTVTETFRADSRGNTLRWTVTVDLESSRDVKIDRVFTRAAGT